MKKTLLQKVKSGEQLYKQGGVVCGVCAFRGVAEVDKEIRDMLKLRREGVRISVAWLVEKHLPQEYGLRVGRETVRRHIIKHLKLRL